MSAEALTDNLLQSVLSRLEPSVRALAETVLPGIRPALVQMVEERAQQAKVPLDAPDSWSRLVGLLRVGELPDATGHPVLPDGFISVVWVRRRRNPLDRSAWQYAVVGSMFARINPGPAVEGLLEGQRWETSETLAIARLLLFAAKDMVWISPHYHGENEYWEGHPGAVRQIRQIYVPEEAAWLRRLVHSVSGIGLSTDGIVSEEQTKRTLQTIAAMIQSAALPPYTSNSPDVHTALISGIERLYNEYAGDVTADTLASTTPATVLTDTSPDRSETSHISESDEQQSVPTLWGGARSKMPIQSDKVVHRMRCVTREGEHGIVENITVFKVSKPVKLMITRAGVIPEETVAPEQEFLFDVLTDDQKVSPVREIYAELAPPAFVPPLLPLSKTSEKPRELWRVLRNVCTYLDGYQERYLVASNRERAEMSKNREHNLALCKRLVSRLRTYIEQYYFAKQVIPDFTEVLWERAQRYAGDVPEKVTTQTPTPASTALPCRPDTFRVPGYGLVSITCPDGERNSKWFNVRVGSHRFGFDGNRWSRGGRIPPQEVLNAARERGHTVFTAASTEMPLRHEQYLTDEENEADEQKYKRLELLMADLPQVIWRDVPMAFKEFWDGYSTTALYLMEKEDPFGLGVKPAWDRYLQFPTYEAPAMEAIFHDYFRENPQAVSMVAEYSPDVWMLTHRNFFQKDPTDWAELERNLKGDRFSEEFWLPGFGLVYVSGNRKGEAWLKVGDNEFEWADGYGWTGGAEPPIELERCLLVHKVNNFIVRAEKASKPSPVMAPQTKDVNFIPELLERFGQLFEGDRWPGAAERKEQPCPDHTGPAHTCPCQLAKQAASSGKRREQPLATSSVALPPDPTDLFPPLNGWKRP